jgi:serine protease AprX
LFAGVAFSQNISEELQQKMDRSSKEFLPVIVVLKNDFNVDQIISSFNLRGNEGDIRDQVCQILKSQAESAHAWLKAYGNERTSQVKDVKSFWITNMVALKATSAAIEEIANNSEVEMIFLDEEKMFLDFKEGTPMRDAWGLKKIGSDKVNQTYRGKGVLVAVIDTGVNYNHNDLSGRVIKGKDCYNNDMDPADDHGHGSHCAGTVAGTTFGVAPEATVLAIKVLGGSGGGSWENVADGVQYTVEYVGENGKRVDIASMSLGGRAPIQPVLRRAFDNAVGMGVRFAIAAGNSGPWARTIGTPGDQKDITSVGATDINDSIANFSSRGPVVAYGEPYVKPDVSGPGVNITSCWIGGNDATRTISGTSMATPHVAGLMALMLEAKPGLKADPMKGILENTSIDLGETGKDNSFGSGRIQAEKAVEVAATGRMELEVDIEFPISADGSINHSVTKSNPLWEMNVSVDMCVLEPVGDFNATFTISNKAGKPQQKGEIKNAKTGQFQHVGKFTIYDGEITVELKGKYTGSANVTKGKARIKAKVE